MLENAPASSKIRKVDDNGNNSHDFEDSSSGYYVNFVCYISDISIKPTYLYYSNIELVLYQIILLIL